MDWRKRREELIKEGALVPHPTEPNAWVVVKNVKFTDPIEMLSVMFGRQCTEEDLECFVEERIH